MLVLLLLLILCRCPTALDAYRLVGTYESPIDFAIQVFATLAGQLLDERAIFSRHAVDEPLLDHLIADIESV